MKRWFLHGKMLALTPWAAARLSPEEQEAIIRRCAALGVNVSVVMSRNGWTLRLSVDVDPVIEWHGQKGPIAPLLGHLLDTYERRGAQEQARWTTEELLQIAAQSPGMEVARA